MTILVCPLTKVTEMIVAHTPGRIVSLLDPDSPTPTSGPAYVNRHLRLSFHDIDEPIDSHTMPSAKHIDALLTFLAAWDRTNPILIHCRAGISRSTAAAFIAACLHNPCADEQVIAVVLRRVSPLARPNQTLIKLADSALNRNGQMITAIMDAGRGMPFPVVDEGEPFKLPSTY